jgi:hypothetical protein
MKPFLAKSFLINSNYLKTMKKLIFGLAYFGVMALPNLGALAQTEPEGPGLEEPCTDSIKKKGSIIYVTVCNRKTSLLGAVAGLSCDVVATESCTFNNINS